MKHFKRFKRWARKPRLVPFDIYKAVFGCESCRHCPHLYGATCEFLFKALHGLYIRWRDLTRSERRSVREFQSRRHRAKKEEVRT